MILTDYTNYMPSSSVPEVVKWIFFIVLLLNVLYYKKQNLSRYIEEYFPQYIGTYASLSFLLASCFLFMTYGKDTYLEVLSIVLGLGISLSYMYNIYIDADVKKIGWSWLLVFTIIILDGILFYILKDKTIAYILCMIQNLIFMIYETKKRTA